MSAVDLFSRCFGCGHDFEPGDIRLRFSMNEWERYEGLPETPIDIGIGMCANCIEPGDWKSPEIVPAEALGRPHE